MTEIGSVTETDAEERLLQAYHDGELGWLARWRFERRLAREPGLRQELEALRELGALAREAEAAEPAPDLWQHIALRLPAVDAERREAPARATWLGLPAPVLGLAAAGAAAVALVVAIGLPQGQNAEPLGVAGSLAAEPIGVVRSVDPGTNHVLVIEDAADATIIWLLDGAEQASRGGPSEVV